MKVVYVAGPYSAPTPWGVEQNIRRAEQVAAALWARGLAALCPHANSRHMSGVADEQVFYDGTLELMRRCDAIVLLPGWRGSRGCRSEEAEASSRSMTIFEMDTEDRASFETRASGVANFVIDHFDRKCGEEESM